MLYHVLSKSENGGRMLRLRRSRPGMLVEYGKAMVADSTNLEKCISLSSTKPENAVLSDVVKIVGWLRNVLWELGVRPISPIFQDNLCWVEWTVGRAARLFNKRKHIDIKNNYMISMQEETLSNRYCAIGKMKADFLARPIAPMERKRELNSVNIFNW